MKAILIICDNIVQYREYMLTQIAKELPSYCIKYVTGIFRIGDIIYIQVCYEDDIRRTIGLERNGIEIRIIGKKATMAHITLRVHAEVFGVTE